MRTLDDPDRLLDLLREAGDEPVSLDELAIVGVADPASALHALELAGHAVHRVSDLRSDRPVTCVRLAGPGAPGAPAVASAPVAEASRATTHRRLLVALPALALTLLLISSRRA